MHKNIVFRLLFLIFLLFNVKGEKSDVRCELAAFLENSDGSERVLIDSGVMTFTDGLKSCQDSVEECESLVEVQAIQGTNGGNFTLPVDETNGYTVGDILCDKADAVEENVRHKIVHIYWRLCGSPWKPTSFKMPEPLCCEDGLYVPCHALKTEL